MRRHQLVLDAPAKHPLDPAHAAVYEATGVVLADHLFADGLRSQRAELDNERVPVQFRQWPNGRPDAIHFGGGLAVLAIVRLRVLQIGQAQLVEREVGRGPCGSKLATAGNPFRNETVVLALAGLRAVHAEVDVPAAEVNDGLAAGVLAVLGALVLGQAGHVRSPSQKR
jgi:hypothetical protein